VTDRIAGISFFSYFFFLSSNKVALGIVAQEEKKGGMQRAVEIAIGFYFSVRNTESEIKISIISLIYGNTRKLPV